MKMNIDGNLCYLATPYSKYPRGLDHAFVDAAQVSAKLLKAGIVVYSPIVHCHSLARYGDLDPLDYTIWLPNNEAMLDACDILIVAHMDGWQDSFGIGEEVKHFEAAEKPIFDLDPVTMRLTKRRAVEAVDAGGCAPPVTVEADEITRIKSRIAELDAEIAAYPSWGAALSAMDGERKGLKRKLAALESAAQVTAPNNQQARSLPEPNLSEPILPNGKRRSEHAGTSE